MQLREIAALVDGDIIGNADVDIVRVAKIEEASSGEITFLANERYRHFVETTGASAILVARAAASEPDLRARAGRLAFVRVADPYRAFLRLVDHFTPAPAPLARGIHPTAVIAPSAVIHPDAAIGAYVVVGERATVGRAAALHPHTVLGEGVAIGAETLVYPSVTIREGCTVGERVIIHSGTVIGSDGFGFAPTPDGAFEKIPQRGIVTIADDVEIGANCTIDRATLGATRIERGVKIDNLVQIAHNVVIGEHTVIAGQAGISGSTKIGAHCMIAGQAGFAGHLTIADRTSAGAKSGFSKSIPEPGQSWFGYPAKEAARAFRIEGAIRQLPELLAEVRALQARIRELEQQLQSLQGK
jgi:UDP-3-O-[3-hydroxymyristoyl] glucosamine N-acyltransferase